MFQDLDFTHGMAFKSKIIKYVKELYDAGTSRTLMRQMVEQQFFRATPEFYVHTEFVRLALAEAGVDLEKGNNEKQGL
jgi:hypothetical protein